MYLKPYVVCKREKNRLVFFGSAKLQITKLHSAPLKQYSPVFTYEEKENHPL